jgi:hypothetical protein
MFGFVLLVFLLLATILAVGVFLAFKSGEQGKTKLGGFAGCAIALALLVIAGLGAVGAVGRRVGLDPGRGRAPRPGEELRVALEQRHVGRAEVTR